MTMGAGKLTIVKAKNWADVAVNPNGLVRDFKLVNGCRFIIDKDWYKPQEDANR
jgi:hypothetical protein